jgi:hypothetical protein
MQSFKVEAWPTNPADWKDNPEWEMIISADIEGDAYSQAVALFRAYCKEKELEFEQFQVRSGSL